MSFHISKLSTLKKLFKSNFVEKLLQRIYYMVHYILFKYRESDYTFFYDETNNIRKFYLHDGRFNVPEDNNFLLGGVFYDKKNRVLDFESLFDSLCLQKNVIEVKLKHIGRGNFIDILNSKKLTKILKWSFENLYLHYINVDIFYWGIVDIVDSTDGVEPFYNRVLKNILYRIISKQKEVFLGLLNKYCYPNIKRSDSANFKKEFYTLVLKYINTVEDEYKPIFIKFMKSFLVTDEFPFIMDETDNVLIDNFSHFYTCRLEAFPNAEHILDIEEEIVEHISSIKAPALAGINFNFVDSKSLREIQLSDILIGFFGKYFTYIKNATMDKVINFKHGMNDTQKKNLSLLSQLILKSDKLTLLSLQSIMSDDEFEKSNYLLFGI